MSQCEKYNPQSASTRYVFNSIYKTLVTYGCNSSMVAACGENLDAYLDYAAMIMRSPKAKAIFVENHQPRFERLEALLIQSEHHMAKKAEIVYGDIFSYQAIPTVKVVVPVRVEDFGLGLRFERLMRMLIPQLDKQRSAPRSNKLIKAQIFDGARKFTTDKNCVKVLNQYLDVIGAQIIEINGQKTSNLDKPFLAGEVKRVYKNLKRSGCTCKVYKHSIKLKQGKRKATLYMYSYINGGMMLAGLLVYK